MKQTTLWISMAALVGLACGEDRPEVPTRPAQADAADWCAEHGVPESMCTVCHPELVARFEEAGDWCAGHGYPESVCPLCHPMEPPAGVPRPEADAPGGGDEAAGGARADLDVAGPPPAAAGEPPFPPGTRIRFRSRDLEGAAGLGTARASAAALDVGVPATARIDWDRNRYAEVTPQVPGVVREVHVDLGATVEAGQVLFTLESVEVGALQARLSSTRERATAARANLERQEALGDIASQRAVELARQEREAAEGEVRAIESSLRMAGSSRGGGRYGLRAPLGGTVVRRAGVVGGHATASEPLAVVADTSRMWALLDVRDADAASLRLGQRVAISVDGAEGALRGTLTWIASEVDPRTRTVAARAEVPNAEGLLRANLFGRARVEVAGALDVVTVPRDAVQRVGDAHVVFVKLGEGYYEPRAVSLGRTGDGVVQARGALEAGETVVVQGAYLLKTELMRDAIGAGCCEVEGPGGD